VIRNDWRGTLVFLTNSMLLIRRSVSSWSFLYLEASVVLKWLLNRRSTRFSLFVSAAIEDCRIEREGRVIDILIEFKFKLKSSIV